MSCKRQAAALYIKEHEMKKVKIRAEQGSGPTSWISFMIYHADPNFFEDFETIEIIPVDDNGNVMSAPLQRGVLRRSRAIQLQGSRLFLKFLHRGL